jgi:putative methanogen marker protein 4
MFASSLSFKGPPRSSWSDLKRVVIHMLTSKRILFAAKSEKRRIGVGSLPGSEKVESSVKMAQAMGYGIPRIFTNAFELASALKDGSIDAAVRGDLDSKLSMDAVKKVFQVDHVYRLALLQPQNGNIFFLAPVGIDEGSTKLEKLELVHLAARLLRRIGEEPSIGIMSGGRNTDLGRSLIVDRSINEAEQIVSILQNEGFNAENIQIMIEEAVRSKNLIIAPDGISGNLIFRCLHLVDGGRSMGAPILNIDKVYIDTSRAKVSYLDSIALASMLVGDEVPAGVERSDKNKR